MDCKIESNFAFNINRLSSRELVKGIRKLSQVTSNMNTTVNGRRCSGLFNPTAQQIGETIAYCLILVVSLVGNSLIVIIVHKTKTMRKPINYFIVNMAMSDLLYPLVLFPLLLTRLYVDVWLISGPIGEAFCKLALFLADNSLIVSTQSLLLIAVDRFGAVAYPLRSPFFTSKQCLSFILATWIVSMVVNIPDLLAFKLVEHQGGMKCEFQYTEAFGESSSEANYTLATNVVFVYIPIALLILLYSFVIIKLKTQIGPDEQEVNVQEQRARRNRGVLRMVIAVVLGFVLCWVPLTVVNLLLRFAWKSGFPSCDIFLILSISHFMAVSNCAINPCICFAFGGKYRRGLKRLVKCFE